MDKKKTFLFFNHIIMGELHPALVHVPIGVLSLYSVCELLRFGTFFRSLSWKKSKAIMLVFGVLGGIGAFMAGDELGETYPESLLLERHELFGLISLWIYGILAASYVIALAKEEQKIIDFLQRNKISARLFTLLDKIACIIQKPPVAIVLALAGFLCLTITGALGGAIVRGPEADFLVNIVYGLFVE